MAANKTIEFELDFVSPLSSDAQLVVSDALEMLEAMSEGIDSEFSLIPNGYDGADVVRCDGASIWRWNGARIAIDDGSITVYRFRIGGGEEQVTFTGATTPELVFAVALTFVKA